MNNPYPPPPNDGGYRATPTTYRGGNYQPATAPPHREPPTPRLPPPQTYAAPPPSAPAPPAAEPEPPAQKRPIRWWRRPWIVPMFLGLGLFFAFTLPTYLPPTPETSRLPLQESFPVLHYLILLGHIGFGMVAIVTCCMQVWPWLRQEHPEVHRYSGRIYIWAGVLPSGMLALVTSAIAVQGIVGRVGNLLLALLWLYTSFKGYSLARRRRYAEHRRWMIRSFALCTSIVMNRVWSVLMVFAVLPFQDSVYGGSEEMTIRASVESAIWLSWVVNAIIAEWWIERTASRSRSRRTAAT